MAKENKSAAVSGIGTGEILAEINLISQIQQIETKLAVDKNSIRFAQLADAYIGIGEFDEAIRICEEGMKTYPFYDTAFLVMAKAYYQRGNKPKAQEILEHFLMSHPGNLRTHKFLGDLALEADDIKTAVARYRTALRMDPINRQIIQALIDLKDQYQKLKDGGDDDEGDEVKMAPRPATETKSAAVKTPVKTELKPEVKPQPVPQPQVKETPKPVEQIKTPVSEAEMFFTPIDKTLADIKQPQTDLQPVEEKVVKEISKPKEQPVETKTVQKAPDVDLKGLVPAYVDKNGLMYFREEDEVSFDQYKLRHELEKAGKAVILEHDAMEAKLAELGAAKAKAIIEETIKKPETKKPIVKAEETNLVVDEAPPKKKKPEPVVKPEPVEPIEPMEETEILSAEEQEAALDEVEMSYKDYLDILTDESALMEAIFTDDDIAEEPDELVVPAKSKTSAAANLVEKLTAEVNEDAPVTYRTYKQSLSDSDLVQEASFESDDDAPISLADYSRSPDSDDDVLDFATYQLISGDGAFDSVEPVDRDEPSIGYSDYFGSLTDTDAIEEARLEEAVKKAPKSEAKKEIKTKEPAKEKATTEVKKKTEEAAPTVEQIVTAKVEKTEEKPIIPAVEEKPVTKPVVEAQTKPVEEVAVIEEEGGEVEELEIDLENATMEMVDQLAARGQFGSAYQACKVLKQKNPTDAKIERKILELKRLYLWSSQTVG
ncbi:tetratricopeptide repeat protein [bacterium]|nr:tetratricopeptide repeat protein [bacterium]